MTSNRIGLISCRALVMVRALVRAQGNWACGPADTSARMAQSMCGKASERSYSAYP